MITLTAPKWFVIGFCIYYGIAFYPNIIEGFQLIIKDINSIFKN